MKLSRIAAWLGVRIGAGLAMIWFPDLMLSPARSGLLLLNALLLLLCDGLVLGALSVSHVTLALVAWQYGWGEQAYLTAQAILSLVVFSMVGVFREGVTETLPLEERHRNTPTTLLAWALRGLMGVALLGAIFPLLPALFALAWLTLAYLLHVSLLRGADREPMRFSPANVALLLVVSLFMLGVGEGGARILFGKPAGQQAIIAPDKDYHYRLNPGVTETIQVPMAEDVYGDFEITVSSLGLRDREFPEKAMDEVRILLLGDSYTFGHGVETDEAISAYLERRLNARALSGRFTVINGGTGGYGPWQSIGTYHRVVDALKPDVVILQTFVANDIGDTLRRDRLYLQAFNLEEERERRFLRLHAYWEIRLHRWLREHSRLYGVYADTVNESYQIPEVLSACRLTRTIDFDVPTLNQPRPWAYEPDLKEWYDTLEYGWAAMRRDIEGLREDCDRRGIYFALYNLPLPFDVRDARNQLAPHGIEHYRIDKANRMVEDWAADQGIPLMPALEALRAFPGAGTLLNPANGHLTPEGCDVFARWLEDFLVNGYIKGGSHHAEAR